MGFKLGGARQASTGERLPVNSNNAGPKKVDPVQVKPIAEKPIKPQSVIHGSAGYKKAYNEGTFADLSNPLDEVVITAGVDYNKYPLYNELSAEKKKRFKDKGAIGRGVRRDARTNRSLKDDTMDMVTGFAKAPITALQAPQSLAVEALEAARGNKFSFNDAIDPNRQRVPSQTIGFEDKPGWDLGGSLNTAMDVVLDPSNLFGAGVAKSTLKGTTKIAKQLPEAFTALEKLNRKTAGKAVMNSIDNSAGLINKTKASASGPLNSALDLSDVHSVGSTLGKEALPANPLMGNPLADGIGNVARFFGAGKAKLKKIEPLARELAEGAPVAKEVFNQTLKNLKSPQGQERLFNETLENLKALKSNAGKSAKQLEGMAKKRTAQRTKTFESTTNVNETLANAIKGDGINHNKVIKGIYGQAEGSTGLLNNATASSSRNTWWLGTNSTMSKPTAAHEIQHLLGEGVETQLDVQLKKLPQLVSKDARNQNYFNKGSKGTESRPFAAEARQAMFDRGILKNKNGTWEEVTSSMLDKAKQSFSKNPVGVTYKGGNVASSTRIFDIIDPKGFGEMAKLMNKLTGAAVPVVGAAGYLKSNKDK